MSALSRPSRRSPAELQALLREARAQRGTSLGRDAWRRLRRNRGAFYALVFLGVFLGTSWLAPLLPLASPMALDLAVEPQPPAWPLTVNPRRSLAGERPPFGAVPTRSIGALADDGWAHRTYVDVELETPLGQLEPTENPMVRSLVTQTAEREATVYLRAGDRPGTFVQRHALPQWDSDRARIDWQPSGERGAVEGTLVRGVDGLYLRLALRRAPGGPTVLAAKARTAVEGVEIELVVEGDTGPQTRRYPMPWRAAAGARVVELQLDGVRLPAEAERDAAGQWPELPEDVAEGRIAFELAGQSIQLSADAELASVELVDATGERLALERRDQVVRELRPVVHDDLGSRVARRLEAARVGRVVGLEHTDGIWELSALDAGLLHLRTRIFGLWQTGPLLGTDAKGRDLLARIVWGSRISIQVSLVATLCSLAIGVTWGAFAGLMGGRIDNLMMRIVDVLYSVPFIFVVIFLITLLNEYRVELADRGIGYMTVFYVVIGAIYWLTMARVVRGQVLSLKNQEFVEAARMIGASTPRILLAHLVPNVLSVVIVYLTLTVPAVMLFEAFLSFLGLGVEPPRVSWGLLAVDATDSISAVVIYWWAVVFPSLAMGSVLLALNVLGDGLRDALDPNLRGKD